MLEDRDGDGTFETAQVYADKLVWPTGVAVWKGGVFVSAAPDILYFKDTDGDGRADVRKQIYTGFGVTNEQQMVNNIMWGVDHKIYASTGGNGGYIRPGGQPDAEPVSVYNRDFRFSPVSLEMELTTQTFQFGVQLRRVVQPLRLPGGIPSAGTWSCRTDTWSGTPTSSSTCTGS